MNAPSVYTPKRGPVKHPLIVRPILIFVASTNDIRKERHMTIIPIPNTVKYEEIRKASQKK